MVNYRVSYIGDSCISDVHHVGLVCDETYYSVVFGRYVNGGFFSIPNFKVGGELASYSDTFWNTESISKSLKNKKAAKAIANIIAEYTES